MSYLYNTIVASEKGANNGIATLDATGDVPATQLDNAQIIYDAIVDVGGGGDYTTVNAALDANKYKLLIKAGTYVLNNAAAVDVPAGTDIVLDAEGNVTIDASSMTEDLFWNTDSNGLMTTITGNITAYVQSTGIFTTSVDMTGQLSVGDWIRLAIDSAWDSNIRLQITAIDASSITIDARQRKYYTDFSAQSFPVYKEPADQYKTSFSTSGIKWILPGTFKIIDFSTRSIFRFAKVNNCDVIGDFSRFLDRPIYSDYPCQFENSRILLTSGDYIYGPFNTFVNVTFDTDNGILTTGDIPGYPFFDNCIFQNLELNYPNNGDQSAFLQDTIKAIFSNCRFMGAKWSDAHFDNLYQWLTFEGCTGSLVNAGAQTYNFGKQALGPLSITTTTGTVLQHHDIIYVSPTTAAAPVTVTVNTERLGSPDLLFIKDIEGGAATNNITIATEGAETIDGAATVTINQNYGSVTLANDGSNLFVL